MGVAIVAALALMLLSAAGCGTPRANLATAVDSASMTLELLTDARQAGMIDDAQAAEITRWIIVMDATLYAWREAIESGEDPGPAIELYLQVLERLTAFTTERYDG